MPQRPFWERSPTRRGAAMPEAGVTHPTERRNRLYTITEFATATGYTNVPTVFQSNPSWSNNDPRIGIARTRLPITRPRFAPASGFSMTRSGCKPTKPAWGRSALGGIGGVECGLSVCSRCADSLGDSAFANHPLALADSHDAVHDPIQLSISSVRLPQARSSWCGLGRLARRSPADAERAESADAHH